MSELKELLNEEIIGFNPKHGIKYIEKLGFTNAAEIYWEWRYDYVRNFDESIIPSGATPKRKKLSPEVFEKMMILYEGGMFPKEIAKTLNISYSVVRTRLCKERRKKGGYKHGKN